MYNNEYQSSNKNIKVASILKIHNDARWKSAERVTWIPLKANWPIHEGDSIFSGEKSKVEVKFLDSKSIVMGAETLLVIEKIDKNKVNNGELVSVQMTYGQVELKSTKNTEWSIKTKNQIVNLKSGDSNTEINIENRKTISVVLKKGQAELNQNGEKKSLSTLGKVITIVSPPKEVIKSDNLKDLPQIEESLPPIVETFVQVQPTINPLPTIQPLPSIQPEKNSELQEVKKTQEVKKIRPAIQRKKQIKLKKESVNEKPKVPEKKEEDVNESQSPDDDSLNSDAKQKIIYSYKPPQPKVPFNGNSIYFLKGNELKINFFWARSAKANSYVLQISSSPIFNTKNLVNKNAENNIDVVLPTDGKYYWRVKGVYADGVSDWSEVQSFFIKFNN